MLLASSFCDCKNEVLSTVLGTRTARLSSCGWQSSICRKLNLLNDLRTRRSKSSQILDGDRKDFEDAIDIFIVVESSKAEADSTAGELVGAAEGADDGGWFE